MSYDYRLVKLIWDLKEEGFSQRVIANTLNVDRNAVRRILAPRWDPTFDEVAIIRALGGDRKVFDALTVWEYKAFIRTLICYRETLDDELWSDVKNTLIDRLGQDTRDKIEAAVSRAN